MRVRERQQGFSALEITIVVLIIAAIGAIAIPNIIAATRSYKLQIAADALAQQLNRTRQEAVRANYKRALTVGSNTSTYIGDPDVTGDEESALSLTTSATIYPSPANAATTVVYTSRGEMQLTSTSTPAPKFKVVYSGKMRVVDIDPRGAVIVGPEQTAVLP